MMSEADATAMREDMVDATVLLKVCSRKRRPPTKKQQPSTRRIFERMLPSILAWTTRTWLSLRAIMLTCTRKPISTQISHQITNSNQWGQTHNQLNSIPKCSIHQPTKGLTHSSSQLLSSKTKQRSERNNSKEIQRKNSRRIPS